MFCYVNNLWSNIAYFINSVFCRSHDTLSSSESISFNSLASISIIHCGTSSGSLLILHPLPGTPLASSSVFFIFQHQEEMKTLVRLTKLSAY